MFDMLHTPVSEFKLQIKGNKKTDDQFIAEHFDFSEVATTGDSIINLEQIRNVTQYKLLKIVEPKKLLYNQHLCVGQSGLQPQHSL